MDESWDAYLASPADFAGEDDIITNLAKERERDHRTRSLFFDYYHTSNNVLYFLRFTCFDTVVNIKTQLLCLSLIIAGDIVCGEIAIETGDPTNAVKTT